MSAYNQNKSDQATFQPPVSGSSYVNVGTTERIISAVGGGILAILGARQLADSDKSSASGIALAASGVALLLRGASGYCPVNQLTGRDSSESQPEALEISKSVTVNKPREEVYAFWRQLENLPQFMKHLSEVKQLDHKRSHWKAQLTEGGLGQVAWDAEITDEIENQRLAWRSVPGAMVDNAGEVHFEDAPSGRGTEIHATILYRPPVGALGNVVTKWLNPALSQMVKEDLRRFKQVAETGELTTNGQGQPAAR